MNTCALVTTTWKVRAFRDNGSVKEQRQLGLSGITTEKDFLNLCRNIHPQTDEQLTPRMNTKRVTRG